MAKMLWTFKSNWRSRWSILDPLAKIFVWSLLAYVVKCPIPSWPFAKGKSINPLITMVNGNGPVTYANPVITHLFPFWTLHPISPEAPDADNNKEPLLATLLHPGYIFVTLGGNPIWIVPDEGI